MHASTTARKTAKLGCKLGLEGAAMIRGANWCVLGILTVAAMLAAGCVTAGSDTPVPPTRPTEAPAVAPAASALPVVPAGFASWKKSFRRKALRAGITVETFDAAFTNVGVNSRVLELDRYQPEFVRPIWEYLDRAVSQTRIADGRRSAEEQGKTLGDIERRYGVDLGIVAAIWGIESAYGHDYGSIPVVESLATLAYDGRRRDFAEEQLIAALRILQSGDATPGRMVGSWAGAMGHTQFIPTSFEAYAVDFTGDGRRDVWAEDPADALASTANYLATFGWQRAEPSVIEIELPPGFDYELADDTTRKSTAEWQAMGVKRRGKGELLPSDSVTLLLPAGARGPAFAAYPNFRVIKRYNNATSYALAVALLAAQIDDTIRFGLTPAMGWPRGDRPLSQNETMELQRRLTALGYPTQGVDGIVGPNTRSAIRGFQNANGMVPDGYLSTALLSKVRAAAGG
jgi:membrane-bound lytic murein transglycosylase B